MTNSTHRHKNVCKNVLKPEINLKTYNTDGFYRDAFKRRESVKHVKRYLRVYGRNCFVNVNLFFRRVFNLLLQERTHSPVAPR